MNFTWEQKIALGLLTTTIILLFFIPAAMLWYKSNMDASSLTTLEGTVQNIGLAEIEIGRGDSKSEIVYLVLEGISTKFGIYYTDSAMRQSYLKKIDKGDQVTVLYNKFGQETDEGFNLHIYELGHNGHILIKNGDHQKRDNNFSVILYCLGAVFLIWPFLLYRYIRKKNTNLQSV